VEAGSGDDGELENPAAEMGLSPGKAREAEM
jgi:hypothetical protein